jgi:hypothetical protein
MGTLIDDVLPIIQDGWQLVEDLGLSPYTVTVRRYVWSTGEVGRGTRGPVDLVIVPNPPVVERKGGEELLVGPILPKHETGGYTKPELVPGDDDGAEFVYVVDGPNGTFNYAFGDIDTSDPVGWMLRLVALELATPT